MNLQLSEGTYVLAVSGGVDSMVLLHLATKKAKASSAYKFIVAHVNHGIREDAVLDEQLVHAAATKAGFVYESIALRLNKSASEDTLRQARYKFLREVVQKYHAKAIVTAHHQDDLIETMLLHVMRGTGRMGLTPMLAHEDVVRPLINASKQAIVTYASTQNIQWHEDSTNSSKKYTRNRLRHLLAMRLTDDKRQEIVMLNEKMLLINSEYSALVNELLVYVTLQNNQILRSRFVLLPHKVAAACMVTWLQTHEIRGLSKSTIERLVVAAKTLKNGKKTTVGGSWWLVITKNKLRICKND